MGMLLFCPPKLLQATHSRLPSYPVQLSHTDCFDLDSPASDEMARQVEMSVATQRFRFECIIC